MTVACDALMTNFAARSDSPIDRPIVRFHVDSNAHQATLSATVSPLLSLHLISLQGGRFCREQLHATGKHRSAAGVD
ncbi:hypothetical protein QR680_019072 [Steinernema hermaphroditum]|uniref:Uncharacterized protein n=1 Tax=Steinernema hermaphroditum TaxID=289476 RepID=A0AA39HJU4_9BILA|nr:hypothetical protein QR680_019072 [Steinernema hermaphroditum]